MNKTISKLTFLAIFSLFANLHAQADISDLKDKAVDTAVDAAGSVLDGAGEAVDAVVDAGTSEVNAWSRSVKAGNRGGSSLIKGNVTINKIVKVGTVEAKNKSKVSIAELAIRNSEIGGDLTTTQLIDVQGTIRAGNESTVRIGDILIQDSKMKETEIRKDIDINGTVTALDNSYIGVGGDYIVGAEIKGKYYSNVKVEANNLVSTRNSSLSIAETHIQ